MCPTWLKLSDDRTTFILVPAVVKVIRWIFRLYLDGLGCVSIAKRLNTAETPTLGRSTCWSKAAIKYILADRRVIGEYQPRKSIRLGRVEAGSPIVDYYPAIISKDDFRKVQQRKRIIPPGRTPKKTIYLFARLLKDTRDGAAIELMRRSPGCKRGGSGHLAPSNTSVGVKPYVSFSYNAFEDCFLKATSELTLDDVLPTSDKGKMQEKLAALDLTIADCDRRIEKLRKRIKDDPNLDILADDVSALVTKRKEAAEQRERLLCQAAGSTDETLHDTKGLIELLAATTGPELIDMRLRLRAKLAELVKEIWVAIVPEADSRTKRTLYAMIFFRSGAFRALSITTERGKVIATMTRKAESETFAKRWLDKVGEKPIASLLPGARAAAAKRKAK